METKEELIFSKEFTVTHLDHGLDIPTAKLPEFGMPEGEHYIFVKVNDEGGMTWQFRLAIRKRGHPKPIIASTDWFSFVKMNQLRAGDAIEFYKIKNEANDEFVGYKVKLKVAGAIKVFGAIFGRQ